MKKIENEGNKLERKRRKEEIKKLNKKEKTKMRITEVGKIWRVNKQERKRRKEGKSE